MCAACQPWGHTAVNPGTPPHWAISVPLRYGSETSQGTLGVCTFQEDNFIQIRIDGNRNPVVTGVTQSNLKYELISQLETVSMSCFSFVLHCAYYLMWKINRQINPLAQPSDWRNRQRSHLECKILG